MKLSGEERIFQTLNEAESGGATKEACAKYNISNGGLAGWRRKSGGWTLRKIVDYSTGEGKYLSMQAACGREKPPGWSR